MTSLRPGTGSCSAGVTARNALLPIEKRAVATQRPAMPWSRPSAGMRDPVAKVTILPAGQALGVTEQLPIDERHLYTEGYLKDARPSAWAAGWPSSWCSARPAPGRPIDLAGATDLATRMVPGVRHEPDSGPGRFASGSPMYLGGEEVRSRPYAEATQRVVDEEVAKLLRDADTGPRSCWASTATPWTA